MPPAVTDRAGAAPAAYLRDRFPLPTQGTALLLMFGCLYLFYTRLGGRSTGWAVPIGMLTFVSLFLMLRLADDFDDARSDQRITAGYRRGLAKGFLCVLTTVTVLNVLWPSALLMVGLSTAAMVIAPVTARLGLWRIGLAVFYEICPALVLGYVYAFWAAASGGHVPTRRVALGIVLLWSLYEYWKFTRKIGVPAFQPYDLSWRVVWIVALLLLLLVAGLAGVAYVDSGLSSVGLIYELAVCTGFLIWMLSDRTRIEEGRQLGWRGVWLPIAVEAGLLVDLTVALTR